MPLNGVTFGAEDTESVGQRAGTHGAETKSIANPNLPWYKRASGFSGETREPYFGKVWFPVYHSGKRRLTHS